MKRAESVSGNIHYCACNAHSELCEGGARVSKKVMNVLHLADVLSAEASEGIAGDSPYVDVIFHFTKQHKDKNINSNMMKNSRYEYKKYQ